LITEIINVGFFLPWQFWLFLAGYFSNEEATSSTLDSEGWLRTGDLCYIDEDGFIFVVDRLKELIKYKGYQVIYRTQILSMVDVDAIDL